MSVYVDELRVAVRSARWPYSHSCHMIADSLEELHRMALSVGLKREWFQEGRNPHYDLTPLKRMIAVNSGAIELDREAFVSKMNEIRNKEADD